ncbi:hypothetical protein [Actinoplanes sp. NPDC049316]|uniref:hypothetical protein n=1 Tax=Actinoplanes sp. NPDC049316 TaxID=3154727 RepID=UPI0034427A86
MLAAILNLVLPRRRRYQAALRAMRAAQLEQRREYAQAQQRLLHRYAGDSSHRELYLARNTGWPDVPRPVETDQSGLDADHP